MITLRVLSLIDMCHTIALAQIRLAVQSILISAIANIKIVLLLPGLILNL